MIRQFLIAGLALGTFATFAEPEGVNPKIEAYSACRALKNDFLKLQCLSVVENARYFDRDIVSVCSSINNDFHVIQCLEKAANERFDSGAARLCRKMSNDYLKVSCVSTIQGKEYASFAIRACGELGNDVLVLACLRDKAGSTFPNPPTPPTPGRDDCSISNFRNKVKGAIGNLKGGNIRATENTLENLDELLARCQR